MGIYIHPKTFVHTCNESNSCSANVLEMHSCTKVVKKKFLALNKKVSEMQAVTSYKTTEWGEPPIYPNSATFSASAEPQ